MPGATREQRDFADALDGLFVPGARLREIGEGLTSQLRSRMDIDWAAIAVPNSEGRVWLLPLAGDVPSQLDGQNNITVFGSPVEWVATNKCALSETDLSSKSRFSTGAPLRREGISSAVYMPLFAQKVVYGTLMVGSHRPQAYKDRELRFLKHAVTRLASPVVKEIGMLPHASPTAEAAREAEAGFSDLMTEAQKRAEEYFFTYVEEGKRSAEAVRQESRAYFASIVREGQKRAEDRILVSELVRIIGSGHNLSQVLDDFAGRLSGRISFDRISFVTLHGEGVRVQWSSPPETGFLGPGAVYPAADCATTSVIQQGSVHVEDDLMQEKQFPIDEIHLARGMRSVARLPLYLRENCVGTINLVSRYPKIYGEEERRFLQQLCDQISLPLGRLYIEAMEKDRLEFLGALVHEVRTPLTAIISSTKLLKEEDQESPEDLRARLVDNVLQSAQRMERRITHFFELSRLRNEPCELDTEIVNVRRMIGELVVGINPIAQSKGQLVSADLSDSLPRVRLNRKYIDQVMLTLLDNAMTFNSEGGTVTLRARGQEGRLIVEITDSGPGFSPSEQKELFTPYYPAEADRLRSPELRLRLAVARELVELHGGNLWMESELGKGSTFAFSLPITPIE
jgi:signal transduction histidine kinase